MAGASGKPCYLIVQLHLMHFTYAMTMTAGEYIAAEKLETDFGTCDLVEQIWVYGNSYEVSTAMQACDGCVCS